MFSFSTPIQVCLTWDKVKKRKSIRMLAQGAASNIKEDRELLEYYRLVYGGEGSEPFDNLVLSIDK